MSDLQSGVGIDTQGVIHGTLHYVTGYTAFDSAHPDMQKGNFCAIRMVGDGSKIECETNEGSGSRKTTLTDDGILVFKVDSTNEVLTVKSGDSTTALKCSGLTLEGE